MSLYEYLDMLRPYLGESIQEYVARTGTRHNAVILYLKVRYFIMFEDDYICSDKMLLCNERLDYLGGKLVDAFDRVSVRNKPENWRYVDIYNILFYNPPNIDEELNKYFERLFGIEFKITTRDLRILFSIYDIKIENGTAKIKPIIGDIIMRPNCDKNSPKMEITMVGGKKRLIEFETIGQINMKNRKLKYRYISEGLLENIRNNKPQMNQKLLNYYKSVGGDKMYHIKCRTSFINCVISLYPDIEIKLVNHRYTIVRKEILHSIAESGAPSELMDILFDT